MFLEVHCYLIDPQPRRIDLSPIAKRVPAWKRFGAWETYDEGVKYYAGWMHMYSAHSTLAF